MKWLERIMTGLVVIALAWCWMGMVGCTNILAIQKNVHGQAKSRYALAPERVAPDGQVQQRNVMTFHISSTPKLDFKMPSAAPSVNLQEAPKQTDKPIPTTQPVSPEPGKKGRVEDRTISRPTHSDSRPWFTEEEIAERAG